MTVTSNDILIIDEVAGWLRQTGAWVRQHANGARRPLLPSIKLGKKRVFRRADIEEFLAKWSVAA